MLAYKNRCQKYAKIRQHDETRLLSPRLSNVRRLTIAGFRDVPFEATKKNIIVA